MRFLTCGQWDVEDWPPGEITALVVDEVPQACPGAWKAVLKYTTWDLRERIVQKAFTVSGDYGYFEGI